jgi:hypothetical protein
VHDQVVAVIADNEIAGRNAWRAQRVVEMPTPLYGVEVARATLVAAGATVTASCVVRSVKAGELVSPA